MPNLVYWYTSLPLELVTFSHTLRQKREGRENLTRYTVSRRKNNYVSSKRSLLIIYCSHTTYCRIVKFLRRTIPTLPRRPPSIQITLTNRKSHSRCELHKLRHGKSMGKYITCCTPWIQCLFHQGQYADASHSNFSPSDKTFPSISFI